MMSNFKTLNRIYGITIVRGFHPDKTFPFKMPEKIERSTTDILQAIANTVKNDETAPNFAYIDDPFTIPTNALQRKKYLLSKEFGRRTARRFVEEWPTLFKFDRDHPKLPVFRPEKPPDPKNYNSKEIDLAIENLAKMIKNQQVTDALELYNKLEKPEISTKNKMRFMRILCYYNEDDIPLTEIEWPANRVYSSGIEKPAIEYSPWKGNLGEPALAEKFFEELSKNDETYSLLICGLLKFPTEYSLKTAKELYQKMILEGHIPFEEVFNYMIRREVPLKSESFDPDEWLQEMGRFGILPTIRTFNSIFDVLTNKKTEESFAMAIREEMMTEIKDFNAETIQKETDSIEANTSKHAAINEEQLKNNNKMEGQEGKKEEYNQQKWQNAISLIRKMNQLGIEPSLTVYWKTLDLAEKNIQIRVNILDEILCRFEEKLKKEEEILFTDSQDHIFFYTGLGITALAQNESLLDRLMFIYRHKLNRVKIQNPWDETVLYQNYLIPKLYTLPLDAFLIIYKQYIPNLASISAFLARLILSEMRFRKPNEFCWQLLKRLIGDCISGLLIENDRLAIKIVQQLRDIRPTFHLSEPDAKEYFQLCDKVISLIEQIEQYREDREKLREQALHENKI